MPRTLRRKPCDSCQILYVNGVRCHELGCFVAWKDYTYECRKCGREFKPKERPGHWPLCGTCRRIHR